MPFGKRRTYRATRSDGTESVVTGRTIVEEEETVYLAGFGYATVPVGLVALDTESGWQYDVFRTEILAALGYEPDQDEEEPAGSDDEQDDDDDDVSVDVDVDPEPDADDADKLSHEPPIVAGSNRVAKVSNAEKAELNE